jgi:hypothetical protein
VDGTTSLLPQIPRVRVETNMAKLLKILGNPANWSLGERDDSR